MPPILLLLFASTLMSAGCYLLGYHAGTSDARSTINRLRRSLRDADVRRAEITKWVKANWPTEYAAYHRGITEGYQQGIDQADEVRT